MSTKELTIEELARIADFYADREPDHCATEPAAWDDFNGARVTLVVPTNKTGLNLLETRAQQRVPSSKKR